MNFFVVIASVNVLNNIKSFNFDFLNENVKVIVIDENEGAIRSRNEELLSELPHEFYGVKERQEWFKDRFRSASTAMKYLQVVPEKCHAETSFGFLVAYEEQPDIVIELDDDVFPVKGINILEGHSTNIFSENGVLVSSNGYWYNTIENLQLNVNERIFARGHPYSPDTRKEDYIWHKKGEKCVLNMGLWCGHPDLDALTILYHGGLDGRCNISSLRIKRSKVIIEKGTFFALCSMNTAFKPEIIPAFYQLYMNFMGVDRFDDIWSGIFLKKVVDHLGDFASVGLPIVFHDKRPRDVFKDLRKEMNGLAINERLWKIVNKIEICGRTYWDAYNSLIEELKAEVPRIFSEIQSRKFLEKQIEKMNLWLEIIDRIR